MMGHSISRYLSVQRASCPAFLAGADRMVFLSDITGVPQVWMCDVPSSDGRQIWPDQLTFAGDRVGGVWTSPMADDPRLIYVRDAGGNERMQLVLMDLAKGLEIPLTVGFESSVHTFGCWAADGDMVFFSSNRRDARFFDLYSQRIPSDGRPEPARIVWENGQPGYVGAPVLDADHGKVYAVRIKSSFEQDLMEIDLPTRQGRILTVGTGTVRSVPIGLDPDGRLLLATDANSDTMRLIRWEPESRASKPLAEGSWDVAAASLSPDGQKVAYTLNVEGFSELHLHDLVTGADQVATGTNHVISFGDGRLSFSPDGRAIACSSTSPVRASDILVWRAAEQKSQWATRSSHAGISTDSFVDAELIRYPTFDTGADGRSREIPAWFYRPVNGEEAPAIVMVHGGPEGQSRPMFQGIIQYFVAQGYAVLAPNVRGSVGYGKAYAHLDDVERRMDSVADLAHAAHWLREQPGIDGERIVVYGGSYGGFMVLSALTTYPELWAAGIDIVGISNFVTFLENTSDYRRAHREAEYGSLVTDRDFLESISPLNHVDKIRVPLMVIHGANDPRVPLSEARQLVAALEEREVPVEFLVFDDEGHGLAKRKNQIVAYEATVAFLERYLDSPSKESE